MGIVAGSVDSEEKTLEVAKDLGFPVAYGITREMGDRVGAWWEERRDHIQPSEFIIAGNGRVLGAAYSSLPVGRMDPAETLTLMKLITSRRS